MNIVKKLKSLADRRLLSDDPVAYARKLGVRIGKDCRLLGSNAATWGSEPWLITIGDHVTLTGGVKIITHDGGVWVFRGEHPDIDIFGPVKIGNNVFVGLDAIIMPGVTIGDNVVIGAGSVVTRDIPSGSVAVGSPAKIVRTTDEYFERVKDKAFHVRSVPIEERRAILLKHFGLDDTLA